MVMIASGGERLIGGFNPLAADISFLSTAYVCPGVGEDDDPNKRFEVFEVRDEHWLKARARRPGEGSRGFEVEIVH